MKKYLILILAITFITSCTKEGPRGKGAIEGIVKHHADPIPGAVVYIKYGAKEFPGTDVTHYDDNVTSDANAKYLFSDLKKGDYYLFAIGFDSAIAEIVFGGVPVEIKNKTETVNADVPVVE
jgi:hypothetical protein